MGAPSEKAKSMSMDHEFIVDIETWGSGNQMLDVVTLRNGKILMITEHTVIAYENRTAFEAGAAVGVLHLEAPPKPAS